MDTPMILLFNIPLIKTAQIAGLCSSMNIQVNQINCTAAGKTIGMLAGCPAPHAAGTSGDNRDAFPSGEMMIFCNLSSDQLDLFLAEYKKRGIQSISLKAVMTPFNINWTPGKLYKELEKEHSFFKK